MPESSSRIPFDFVSFRKQKAGPGRPDPCRCSFSDRDGQFDREDFLLGGRFHGAPDHPDPGRLVLALQGGCGRRPAARGRKGDFLPKEPGADRGGVSDVAAHGNDELLQAVELAKAFVKDSCDVRALRGIPRLRHRRVGDDILEAQLAVGKAGHGFLSDWTSGTSAWDSVSPALAPFCRRSRRTFSWSPIGRRITCDVFPTYLSIAIFIQGVA